MANQWSSTKGGRKSTVAITTVADITANTVLVVANNAMRKDDILKQLDIIRQRIHETELPA